MCRNTLFILSSYLNCCACHECEMDAITLRLDGLSVIPGASQFYECALIHQFIRDPVRRTPRGSVLIQASGCCSAYTCSSEGTTES